MITETRGGDALVIAHGRIPWRWLRWHTDHGRGLPGSGKTAPACAWPCTTREVRHARRARTLRRHRRGDANSVHLARVRGTHVAPGTDLGDGEFRQQLSKKPSLWRTTPVPGPSGDRFNVEEGGWTGAGSVGPAVSARALSRGSGLHKSDNAREEQASGRPMVDQATFRSSTVTAMSRSRRDLGRVRAQRQSVRGVKTQFHFPHGYDVLQINGPSGPRHARPVEPRGGGLATLEQGKDVGALVPAREEWQRKSGAPGRFSATLRPGCETWDALGHRPGDALSDLVRPLALVKDARRPAAGPAPTTTGSTTYLRGQTGSGSSPAPFLAIQSVEQFGRRSCRVAKRGFTGRDPAPVLNGRYPHACPSSILLWREFEDLGVVLAHAPPFPRGGP